MSDPRPELIQLAHLFYSRGWMIGSTGCLSVRMKDRSLWTMVDNRPRRNMDTDDFIRISPDKEVIERAHSGDKVTPEIDIHLTIYQMFPRVGACYQVPSVEANLVSNLGRDSIAIPELAVTKGLGVSDSHSEIPIFDGHFDYADIAQAVYRRFQKFPPMIPALLIRNDCMVVWASTLVNALNYIEILDYVLRYIVASKKI